MDCGRKPSRQNPGTLVWGHHDLLRKGLVKGRGEGGAALAPPGGLQHWMCASSLQHPASLRGPPNLSGLTGNPSFSGLAGTPPPTVSTRGPCFPCAWGTEACVPGPAVSVGAEVQVVTP